LSEEHKRALSLAKKGKPLSLKNRQGISRALAGRRLSEEHKRKISESLRGRELSAEHKKKLSEASKRNNPRWWATHPYPESAKAKLSKIMSDKLKDPEIRRDWVARLWSGRRPTRPELKLLNIINANNLPYKYVGDGKLFLGNPPMNPDFIHETESVVIEVFGSYWHSKEDEEKRIEAWNKLGFECTVIWDFELNNEERVLEKIYRYGGQMNRMMVTRTVRLPLAVGGD